MGRFVLAAVASPPCQRIRFQHEWQQQQVRTCLAKDEALGGVVHLNCRPQRAPTWSVADSGPAPTTSTSPMLNPLRQGWTCGSMHLQLFHFKRPSRLAMGHQGLNASSSARSGPCVTHQHTHRACGCRNRRAPHRRLPKPRASVHQTPGLASTDVLPSKRHRAPAAMRAYVSPGRTMYVQRCRGW